MNQEVQLLKATIEGDEELIYQLLKKGLNPNCKDASGKAHY